MERYHIRTQDGLSGEFTAHYPSFTSYVQAKQAMKAYREKPQVVKIELVTLEEVSLIEDVYTSHGWKRYQ